MEKRLYILIAVIIAISLAIYLLSSYGSRDLGLDGAVAVSPRVSIEEKSKKYELAKEITSPDGFINTDFSGSGQMKPITVGEFVGNNVVLVDFWTYSCINCQRTIPYLNSWHEKYKDKGLVILGLHTPEFEFEKDYENVIKAVEKFGIKYPVVLDNDYSTWKAYKNRYWPRKYLIDIDGYIIYDHIGEGAYQETEKKIQEALNERMVILEEEGKIKDQLTKEISIGQYSKSPETYFGAARNEFFANGTKGVIGTQDIPVLPSQINLNSLYLEGSWDIQGEFAENKSENAKIAYVFSAKDVFFVARSDEEVFVEILVDGQIPKEDLGEDVIKTVEGKSVLKIQEARLYKIIQGDSAETHKLELIIQKPGLKAFTFTFG